MAKIDGNTIIARALQQQGLKNLYGVVGHPISAIAGAAQREGIHYYGMRHEQAAVYAAQASAYLNGRIGALITVPGPGTLNAVSGFANAWSNRWPLLLLGGGAETTRNRMGDFQEADQVPALAPYAKFAYRAEHQARLPIYIAEAVRKSISGVPGPSYLELPGDLILDSMEEEDVQWAPYVPAPPRPSADPNSVEAAIEAIKSAENPLVIFGKGVAWARAEQEMRRFLEVTGLPHLATPMGKGVVADSDDHSAAAARTFALQNADLIFLVGARFNWILHYGLPPRFKEGVRLVQLDLNPEEIGVNVPAEVGIVGDAKVVLGQMIDVLEREPWEFPQDSEWISSIRAESSRSAETIQAMMDSDDVPMGYYRPLREIRDALPDDAIIIAEGASTMDISRTVLGNAYPRLRLDAGTFGTMGVGAGFAIAAQVEHPEKKVLALQGDAAFGFGGMEVEVSVRYNLPITWVVFVNNGIGGHEVDLDADHLPPGGFTPNVRYDRVMEAFGGKGYHVETPDEFRAALKESVASDKPALINVAIDPNAARRPQKFGWLTR